MIGQFWHLHPGEKTKRRIHCQAFTSKSHRVDSFSCWRTISLKACLYGCMDTFPNSEEACQQIKIEQWVPFKQWARVENWQSRPPDEDGPYSQELCFIQDLNAKIFLLKVWYRNMLTAMWCPMEDWYSCGGGGSVFTYSFSSNHTIWFWFLLPSGLRNCVKFVTY